MTYVIDRRLNTKKKSEVNRQRFLERHRKHIQRAVQEAVDRRSITDMERGEQVTIPAPDVSEPVFQHGAGGERTIVHPGNKEYIAGDRVPKPEGGGQGGGGGKASNDGEGDDAFAFELTQDEFLGYLFEGLELPNLAKQRLRGDSTFRTVHAGYSTDGTPAKLSVLRSMRVAKGRRIALSATSRRRLREIAVALEAAEQSADEVSRRRLLAEQEKLERRVRRVPFLDTTDLRYNLHVKQPQPTSQAVMFCLMDVSGSMDQQIKDMAKRFYLLLYMFLKRNYEKTEVVFIRHHTVAREVDEQEFFYSRETGGTVVSSALRLMADVVTERYPPAEWNIYAAQASDGDNWNDDSPLCGRLLRESLLPLVQYFTYVEISRREHQSLWHEYESVSREQPGVFAMRQIREAGDIYPVFHELFSKDVRQAS
ncbi:MAG: YeaH/YhbH family protein [Pseudomonadales bacterium]|nr:YeaH/YhbH family protein [Pseudomonadales bacterium]